MKRTEAERVLDAFEKQGVTGTVLIHFKNGECMGGEQKLNF